LAAAVHPSISASTDEKLSGKIFVLTGKLPSISREEATRRIEAAGGIVRGSVSKNTNYVIAGDDPGEKLIKAKDLNIPVLDEAGLLNLLREGQNNSSVP
jgi:DNA ligase (NAD+)